MGPPRAETLATDRPGGGGDGGGAEALALYLAESFQRRHGVDPRHDPRAWGLIREAAVRAWDGLQIHPAAAVVLPCLLTSGGTPLHLDIMVTRADLTGVHYGGQPSPRVGEESS